MCKGWTDESSSILIPLSPWSEFRMRILWSTALTFSFLPIVMQASVIVCKSGGKILLTCFFSIWLHLSARRRRWTSFSSALTTCVQILASTQELVYPHKFLFKFHILCPHVNSLLIAEFHFLLSSYFVVQLLKLPCHCPIPGANEGVFASPDMITPNLDKVSKWSVRKVSNLFLWKAKTLSP